MINFSCNLLREHFEILEETIKKYKASGNLSGKTELKRLEETGCVIIIPANIPGTENLNTGDRITGIPKDVIENITSIVEDFRDSALDKELRTTEFIPLHGYPLKDLQNDLIEAIKNHRNFCLLDEYSEYKRFSRKETTKLRQHKIMYPSNDYSEIALYIYEGDLKSLRERYTPKLEEVDWG